MKKTTRQTRISNETSQSLPICVSKYFREFTPGGRRLGLTWSALPWRFRGSRINGVRPKHVTTRRVSCGRTLLDVLDAIAAAAGEPPDSARFSFLTMASHRIKVELRTNVWGKRAGQVAHVHVDGIVSPLPWREVDHKYRRWETLPHGVDAGLTYGRADIERLFTPEQLAMTWRWKRPGPKSERSKAWDATMKLSLAVMRAKHLTLADVASLTSRVKALNAERRGAR